MPTSRIAQAVRKLVVDAATVDAQEIRMQAVQGISAAGRYVIDGATISAVGTARLAVGQIVPVVYESGRPLVIFALEWQRGRGEVGQEQALGIVEELLLLRAASPDPGSLWFRSDSQIIRLDVVAAAGSVTLGLANITALKWGDDQNSFVLQGTIPVSTPPGADDGKAEFFLFALSRGRAGETVGGVTFLRRERPWSRSDIALGTVAATYREQITTRSVTPRFTYKRTDTDPFGPITISATYGGVENVDRVYDSSIPRVFSTTSNTISVGFKTFATTLGYLYPVGGLISIHGPGLSNIMIGTVMSVSATSLTMFAVIVYGSGTWNAWDVYTPLAPTTLTLTMLGAGIEDFDLNAARELVVLASAADFVVSIYQGGARWNRWLVNLSTKTVLWSTDLRAGASWGRQRTSVSLEHTRSRFEIDPPTAAFWLRLENPDGSFGAYALVSVGESGCIGP